MRAQNAHPPVNRLAAELLCAVLLILNIRERILASAVCHYWREVAVNCPLLWATLDNTARRYSADAFIALLRRSKDVDAHVNWNLARMGNPTINLVQLRLRIIDELRLNLYHIRTLTLHCSSKEAVRLLSRTTVTRLQRLELVVFLGISATTFEEANPEGGELPHALFCAPIDLRTIKAFYPRLTHLSVACGGQHRRALHPDTPFDIDVGFESLMLHGEREWIGAVSSHIRRSITHALLQAYALPLGQILELPGIGDFDELALGYDSERRGTVVAVRSGSVTRTLMDTAWLDRPDVTIPSRLLGLSAWMHSIVSLSLVDQYWLEVTPASAPALQCLTVLLDKPIADHLTGLRYAELFSEDNIFTWRCSGLTTVTIGSEYYGSHESELRRLPESRLTTFLRDMLGFDSSRKLCSLVLKNVALVDDAGAYLATIRQGGLTFPLTDAALLVQRIEMKIDEQFDGQPHWWEHGIAGR